MKILPMIRLLINDQLIAVISIGNRNIPFVVNKFLQRSYNQNMQSILCFAIKFSKSVSRQRQDRAFAASYIHCPHKRVNGQDFNFCYFISLLDFYCQCKAVSISFGMSVSSWQMSFQINLFKMNRC